MAENTPAPSDNPQQTPQPQPQKSGGYGNRPLWQWILLYVIVGSILYFAVYYFFFRHTGTTSLY